MLITETGSERLADPPREVGEIEAFVPDKNILKIWKEKRRRILSAAYVAAYARFLNLYPYVRYVPRWTDFSGVVTSRVDSKVICCLLESFSHILHKHGKQTISITA